MIYLASPYSHPDPLVRQARYHSAATFVARELWNGLPLFSPICYAHHMANEHNMPLDAASWAPFNEWMISKSYALWVLRIEGWDNSVGVNAEIVLAHSLSIPVEYKDPF